MAQTETTVLVRGIDIALWRRVKAKAAMEGLSLKAVIVKLLTKWVGVAIMTVALAGCGNFVTGPSLRTPVCHQTAATSTAASFDCQSTRRSPVVPVGCAIDDNVITCHTVPVS